MWGALNKLAEQAKSVAAELEGQLDASVGIENNSSHQQTTTISGSGGGFSSFLGGGDAAGMEDLDDNNNSAWNDDDFQVDDVDDDVFTSKALITPTETTTTAAVEPRSPPPVATEVVAATPTPTAAEISGAGGDEDDSGWDDENLQFDEVNLHAAGSKDEGNQEEQQQSDVAAESTSSTTTVPTTTSPSVSPKAKAAAAVAAVADALPAVSGFFSSKIKAKLEAPLTFLETGATLVEAEEEEPLGVVDVGIPSEPPHLAPSGGGSNDTTKVVDEQEEDREVTDGWAGDDNNDDLDLSEVDNNAAPESLVVVATSITPTAETTHAAGPDSTNSDISPPPLQQLTTPESPAKVDENVVADATLLSSPPLQPVVDDEALSSPSPTDTVVDANVQSPPPLELHPIVTISPAPAPTAAAVTDTDISDVVGGLIDSSTTAATTVMTEDAAQQQLASQQEITRLMENRLDELHQQLQQREQQLMSKTEQMSQMQQMFDVERQEMQNRLEGTKDEAKRRIQMAKDRVESMEAKLQAATAKARSHSSSLSEDAAKQQEIIDALRQEGEKLAVKQLSMEKAVRAAKTEARELREELELEQQAKSTALEKIEQLEAELKQTKDSLTSARQSASQADKLESTLQQAREDGDRKASTIMSLEQQVKELKAEAKDLLVELESSRKGMAIETEREQKKLRKEHNSVIDDLETKLRTTEKEAAVREDALRHEVSELRKRWQDAVRRADSLSMDVQSSTAPLLRQLESMERQSRARAAGWAELETKLRAELEETVISNEKLSKDRMDFKTKLQRLERTCKERDEDLRTTKASLEDATVKIERLEAQVSDLETQGAKQKQEWAEMERLANEGVSRVRSEMTQTVVEAENRHRSQLDALEVELRQERDKKRQLEQQVQDLLDNNAAMMMPLSEGSLAPQISLGTREKKLRNSENQMSILAGALNGLGNENMDDDDNAEDDDDDDDDYDGDMPAMNGGGGGSGSGSFAALTELSSKLKVAKGELQTLRKSLADSERTRENLLVELGESRNAKEKLPLFETRVEELTRENREMRLEIQGLQDDVAEVRELYRTQLNVLLEEKAATASSSNGDGDANDDANTTGSNNMSPFETEAAPPEQGAV